MNSRRRKVAVVTIPLCESLRIWDARITKNNSFNLSPSVVRSSIEEETMKDSKFMVFFLVTLCDERLSYCS